MQMLWCGHPESEPGFIQGFFTIIRSSKKCSIALYSYLSMDVIIVVSLVQFMKLLYLLAWILTIVPSTCLGRVSEVKQFLWSGWYR